MKNCYYCYYCYYCYWFTSARFCVLFSSVPIFCRLPTTARRRREEHKMQKGRNLLHAYAPTKFPAESAVRIMRRRLAFCFHCLSPTDALFSTASSRRTLSSYISRMAVWIDP